MAYILLVSSSQTKLEERRGANTLSLMIYYTRVRIYALEEKSALARVCKSVSC